ncbi:MAG: glutamate-cysteine ligase family protein [Caldilineaceae bacterium]
MYDLDEAIAALADRFVAGFPAAIPTQRTVGREAEYPVVKATGEAADVRRVLEDLRQRVGLEAHYDSGNPHLIVGLDGEAYSYALEVGVGTVEINSRPCRTLFAVERAMREALRLVVQGAARYGWRVLGYGIQPLSPPTLQIMAPKQRYQSLYRAMANEWLWYTVTASDQCHVAIGQPELVQMLNVGNMMAPVLIALCGNSPVYGGKLSPFCSAREGRMAQIHANEYRHGMPEHPYTSIADYVRTVAQSTYLIVRAGGEIIPSSRPFTEYLREHGPDYPAFLFHEHYIWNSARLRTAYGTLEIRPACQQPGNEQMAAMALAVGLMEAAPAIDGYIQNVLGERYWSILRTYHQQVTRVGLTAPQPAPDFLPTMVDFATQGLARRGHGEEVLLTPIENRLLRRQNPGQRARQVYDLDGMAGLLDYATIRPTTI